MQRRSILFVDDEPKILSGLKRMLRTLRKEMDFHFVESGKEALDFMGNHHVDIVVTDMRMPCMDGAALLNIIKEQFPHSMRIVLSGHADETAVLATVGVAHQFLAKPTSPDVLKEVLYRACRLQDVFTNNELKACISRIGRLPSLPAVYAKLQEKLKDPECSLDDITAVIEQDMAMSAKVLHLVNSAFFGLYRNVESPARAVNLLGLDTVKALVLSVGVFTEISSSDPLVTAQIRELWQHSLATAVYAKKIAQLEGLDNDFVNDVFIAGILHDIGKLLLLVKCESLYGKVLKLAETQQISSHMAEREVLQADHAEAGGYLIGLWGLPAAVMEAVTFHHRLEAYPGSTVSPALIVHAADVIDRQLRPSQVFAASLLCEECLHAVGLAEKFAGWLDACRTIIVEDAFPV